jgi:hypothetical protein
VVQGCTRVEGATSVAGTRIGCDDEVIGFDVIRSILFKYIGFLDGNSSPGEGQEAAVKLKTELNCWSEG